MQRSMKNGKTYDAACRHSKKQLEQKSGQEQINRVEAQLRDARSSLERFEKDKDALEQKTATLEVSSNTPIDRRSAEGGLLRSLAVAKSGCA